MTNPENNLITIQTHKEVTRLYKTFLEQIEDLRKEHEILIKKITEKNGPEFAKNVDFFTQEKYEQLRKRVLDGGNECSRQMLNFLDFFDFTINKEKVEAAANQRKIVKKVIINNPIILQ